MRSMLLRTGLLSVVAGCQAGADLETSRSPSTSAESLSRQSDGESAEGRLDQSATEVEDVDEVEEVEEEPGRRDVSPQPQLEQAEPERAQTSDGTLGVGSVSPVYGSDIPHARPSRTSLRAAGMDVHGAMVADDIWRVIDNHEAMLERCYDIALAEEAGLAGLVEISFAIGKDGAVIAPQVTAETSPELRGVAICMARAIRHTKFLSRDRQSITGVVFRLELSPTGGKSIR